MLHSLIFFQLWINFEIFWTFFFFFLKTQFFNVLLIHCALVVFIMPSKSNSFFSCQTKRISLFDICWISFPHLVKKTPLFSSLIYQNGGMKRRDFTKRSDFTKFIKLLYENLWTIKARAQRKIQHCIQIQNIMWVNFVMKKG